MEVVNDRSARILLLTSLLTVPSCVLSAHLSLYDCFATSFSVLFFSVNYWRRPTYGLRRNLDIINTLICLMYQLWASRELEPLFIVLYVYFTLSGMACFLLGYVDHTVHSGVHVFGNIANVFLYMGLAQVRGGLKHNERASLNGIPKAYACGTYSDTT